MNLQQIPVDSSPQQSFNTTVSFGNPAVTVTLQLVLRYNTMAQYWEMDISDATGNLLIAALPLLTGAYPGGNLLQQFEYLGIGNAYILNASGTAEDYPDDSNLGSDFILVWGD